MIGQKENTTLIEEFITRFKQDNSNLFSIEEWDYLCDRVRYHSVTGKPRDVWRDTFDPKDPPAKVPPFKIQLKPNSEPYIAKSRKYNEEEIRFLKLWNESLIAGGSTITAGGLVECCLSKKEMKI